MFDFNKQFDELCLKFNKYFYESCSNSTWPQQVIWRVMFELNEYSYEKNENENKYETILHREEQQQKSTGKFRPDDRRSTFRLKLSCTLWPELNSTTY